MFASRKIKVQLRGSRLPLGYTVDLRLTKAEDSAGRARNRGYWHEPHKRRKRPPRETHNAAPVISGSNEGDSRGGDNFSRSFSVVDGPMRLTATRGADNGGGFTGGRGGEEDGARVRETNTYAGASDSVGGVCQRRWYLSEDRRASGLVRGWESGVQRWHIVAQSEMLDSRLDSASQALHRLNYPFFVRGPEIEFSVVTGRTTGQPGYSEGCGYSQLQESERLVPSLNLVSSFVGYRRY